MYSFGFTGLPVIRHEYGQMLSGWIYLAACVIVFILYMVAGHRKKIPLSLLLLGAATFFLCFAIGSRLPAFTSAGWNLLFADGHWPGAQNRTILGGLAGVLAGMLIFASLNRNSRPVFDLVAIVLPAGMGIQRIACLLSGCCAGLPANLPWAVRYDQHSDAWNSQLAAGQVTTADPCSLPVHPTQVYDILAWMIVFLLAARAARFFRSPGHRLLLTILLYGVFRFFLEFLRDPCYDLIPGTFSGIKNIQWMILAGLPLPALILMAGERRARRACKQEARKEDREAGEEAGFAKQLILTLVVVSLFLLSQRLLSLAETLAMTLLLAPLGVLTAIRVFRKTETPDTAGVKFITNRDELHTAQQEQ